MHTPITYYGGKQRLAKHLLQLVPQHKLYIEPFMGGGALFFAKEASTAEIINDINGEVTNFYTIVKTRFGELQLKIEGTPHSRVSHKEAMTIYKHPEHYTPIERAWAFWVVTNQGFGGEIHSWALSRDGKIGKTLANKRKAFTQDYAKRLDHVQIESKDALELIKQYDTTGSFFYLDPPYYNSNCGHYKGFTEAHYINLLEQLTQLKGKFLLSSYPSPILKEYIEKNGWHYKTKEQTISVNKKVNKRKTEVMIYNYPDSETNQNDANKENTPVHYKPEKSKQKMQLKTKKSGAHHLHKLKTVWCFVETQKYPAMQNTTSATFSEDEEHSDGKLITIHDNKLLLKSTNNRYYILGTLPQDLSTLQITLMVEETATSRKERTKIDLYERETLKNFCQQIAEAFHQNDQQIEADLLLLTDELEKHRDTQTATTRPNYQNKRTIPIITPETQKNCIAFLTSPNLIERIDQLIEQAGVVGEENTRKLIYIIASTYKMNTPLHSLVQGSSGSGKSHLINAIGQCFPPEDVISMTRVTSKSFYHYNKDELVDKLLLIQDFDGLDEEAQYAFRELQSAGTISSSTTYKDKNGNIVSCVKNVRSRFASLLATTKAEIYYDNMSRSVVLGVDESDAQTMKIINYQNKKLSGSIDTQKEQQAKQFLQNCMRCIQAIEVVNPYADKIKLPLEAKMLRRLNTHYQSFVKQITILNQYQRQKDEQGRLIAQKEDLITACDILFDAIILKIDDLDSSLRQFFDRMKTYVKTLLPEGKTPEGIQFTQREIRIALNISKTQCFRFMEGLEQLEYLQKTGGYANRGFKYKIIFWDDMQTIKERIKKELNNQLEQLKNAA